MVERLVFAGSLRILPVSLWRERVGCAPLVMKFPPGHLRSVCAITCAARINAPAIAVRAGPALVTALAVATLHDWPGCLYL